MDADFIQALQATKDPEDKAALIAEAGLEMFSNEVAQVARQCVLFHWFDQSIVEGLLQAMSSNTVSAQDVYRQITFLPFVEQSPWGTAYQDLTRQGLLKYYAHTQPDLLKSAARIAAPLYRASTENERNTVEALFCSFISGDAASSLYLNTLLEQAMSRQDWQQMESLFRLQEEAERFSFVESLPRTEQYWMLRSIVNRVQAKLEAALIDYDHALTINPGNALAYLNRSIVHTQQMHYELAQADYDEALQLDPALVQTYVDGGILSPPQDRVTDKLEPITSDRSPDLVGVGTRYNGGTFPETFSHQQVQTQYNAGHDVIINRQPFSSKQLRQNRQRMLAKVRAFWIEGVLEHSLHSTVLITLGLEEQSAVLAHPWHMALQESGHTVQPLPDGTRITQVFDEANGELLILGAAGSGKTTLLLELTRDLLERAHQDESHPIPVVFNLSSWAMKRLPLSEWLVVEMNAKYQIPRPLAASWIATDQVVPLLDGLDEVEATHRSACVEAINAYRQAQGLLPTVVCSRQTDYLVLSTRLLLRTAVVVQPLTSEQIETYLISAGEHLAALYRALQEDPDLQALASTPLMLNVLMVAYQGTSHQEMTVTDSLGMKQERIFATYVQRMLARRNTSTRYTLEQTIRWLTWLAQQMLQHSQTVFYIEQMQPDWLSSKGRRKLLFYHAVVGLIVGLIAGLAVGLIFGQLFGLVGGIIGGLIAGLIGGVATQEKTSIQPAEKIIVSWANMKQSIASGFVLGVGGILGSTLGSSLGIGLVGVLTGALAGIFSSMLIAGLVAGGVSSKMIEPHERLLPNEGIRHSLRNSVIVALISGLVGALAIGLTTGVIRGLTAGLAIGLVAGLINGGLACIQHFVLRFFLWRAQAMPWNYPRFLDYAAERVLLRKVGGGYIFVHRLLLDYFTSLEAPTNKE
jgi:tetratricopeptide (TPR) repeat protein/MFS family permease